MADENGPVRHASTTNGLEAGAVKNHEASVSALDADADRVAVGPSPPIEIGRYVAIDCEMVGVGPYPSQKSALARVSLVNYHGEQVYDAYVLPVEPVTDWRTEVSGIRPHHMRHARSFQEAQDDVAALVKDKVLVGHSIQHDLRALMINHPRRDIRDTAYHPPFRKIVGGSLPGLRVLVSEMLGVDIQHGEHSSVEDARACMSLFRKDKAVFEREHAKRWPARPVQTGPGGPGQPHPSQRSGNKKKKKK